MQAEAPPDELERLAALRRLLVLDTPPERQFDELADVARRVCRTPTALITFVDRDRQWFKARLGFDRPETPREIAFCAHTLLEGDLLVAPDAVVDPRFADNRW